MGNIGECCICGYEGKLSFEHVPPRAAFNDRGVFQAKIDGLIDAKWRPGEPIIGARLSQKGAGRHSLCGKCNNDTGAWYGPAYVDFAQQAMALLIRSRGAMSLAYPYGIFPLKVLKQIVTMFFSACGPELRKTHPDLVKFVLNRDQRYFPGDIRIWAYLHHPESSISTRQSGVTGRMTIGGKQNVFSEIAFPPFGLIMSFDAYPVEDKLCNLTYFNQYRINVWEIEYLKLPVLPVVSFFPGDFRTVEEIKRDAEENDKKLGSYYMDAQPGALRLT